MYSGASPSPSGRGFFSTVLSRKRSICRTFGYTFPEKMLGKFVKSLSLSFVARNPFIVWKNIPNIDPDSGYNTSGMGLEYGSLPSRRSYGFNVNVKF